MNIDELVEGILSGERAITYKEACLLAQPKDKEPLYEGAHRITRTLMGNGFDTCSIINVKSGNCPEDCRWCAQSRHYHTGADTYPLLASVESVAQAVYNRKQGVNRFSLVASGRTQSTREITEIADTFRDIRKACDIECCASLGLLNEEKLTTIKAARRVGMRICSGGIIGMGETMAQRIEFAFVLRSLDVHSIPINVLHPIPGTPLADNPRLSEEEYLTTVALFRYINPKAYLRFSGGRDLLPLTTVRKAMYIAINSAITGDMLTTTGARCEEDMTLIRESGYTTEVNTDWEIMNNA